MAKGATYKKEIIEKIMEVFPNHWYDGKELRICGIEGGEEVQIKVALTCAKENIDRGIETGGDVVTAEAISIQTPEISATEKENLKQLMKQLDL